MSEGKASPDQLRRICNRIVDDCPTPAKAASFLMRFHVALQEQVDAGRLRQSSMDGIENGIRLLIAHDEQREQQTSVDKLLTKLSKDIAYQGRRREGRGERPA